MTYESFAETSLGIARLVAIARKLVRTAGSQLTSIKDFRDL